MSKYLIVLFKDKKRKKIINKFQNEDRALRYYNKLINRSESVFFSKEVVSGYNCRFELALIATNQPQTSRTYLKDQYGRNLEVKLEDTNMSLLKVSDYKIEEEFFDFQKKKKINSTKFISSYLNGQRMKMISSLNNKIVVQEEDEINLFSFKSDEESQRFLDCLSDHFFKIRRKDCLIIKDTSSPQKKYLYDLLEKKGFEKQFLYRKFTSLPHPL